MPSCTQECSAPCHDAATIRGHIASMVRTWRASDHRSLDSLASLIGVSRSTISLWERGGRLPTLENLVCLAQVMDEPLCRFFCPESKEVSSKAAPNPTAGVVDSK